MHSDYQQPDLAARGAKRSHLDSLVQATVDWATSIELPEHLAPITALSLGNELESSAAALLKAHAPHLSDDAFAAVLIESALGADWPKGSRWSLSRAQSIRTSAALLYPALTTDDVSSTIAAHRRASKRLRKDALSPRAQVGMGAFMAAGALLSGGAVNAVGTAVGTQVLGLSGAAATSAGLAFIGGGSLAAGGFGMAGGQLLINTAAVGVKSASKALLGAVIAKSSSTVFISELAKLDVLVGLEPRSRDSVVEGLLELKKSINHDRTKADGRDAKNLATSERAIDFEIRHLTSPGWKRIVAAGPRLAGTPALSKLLDRIG
ncbi:hypothetical protein [Allobranchiibius sp. GilTou73]|uniref:hypothetical protein n=1 Tax=Allobranchiibius sp. GilTou73 TaxID=2904523 RepID=UPI001F3EBBF3|nr:hypothetical protein [Allobranchiibius sp. GilTou73]UIJ35082.1 hypothetical protein LVQ62_01330 [Allobranchiibius sp. GilTou73]